jgi:hypothetical protein
MASGKRMEDETFEDYRLRLWCEEKAFRLYTQRRFDNLSYDGCIKKIQDMMLNVADTINTETEIVSA